MTRDYPKSLLICRLTMVVSLFFAWTTLAQAEVELTWAGCGITKHAFMKELAQAYETKTGIKIKLEGGGATRGIHDTFAMESHIDMGGTCRNTTQGENRSMGGGLSLTAVAWDALVIIVNKNNPIETISMDELRDVYRGQITNWKELGGEDRPIKLFIRKGKISGVGATLRKLVFLDPDIEFTSPHVFKSSGPLEKALLKDENAIAVTGISSARRREVKLLKLEGKAPTYENIKSGDYILYRPLRLVSNKLKPSFKEAEACIRFAQSEEGREIIRANGTVPYKDGYNLILPYLKQNRQANTDMMDHQRK